MENQSIRAGYEELGVDEYYKEHSDTYSNPHIDRIEYLLKTKTAYENIGNTVLDLCCGSGEITNILLNNDINNKYNIDGLDPYTASAYTRNTGQRCMKLDFKDIVLGALKNKRCDTIICSYAMHLCEESMLNNLLYQLSLISETLIIVTPHKRPDIKQWWIEVGHEKYEGTTLKVYKRSSEWV